MAEGGSSKVVLAEAFDYAKKADLAVQAAEANQQGWLRSSDRDVAKVKGEYKKAYTYYIAALERFNQVRRTAVDADMKEFCTEHMNTNMSKCEMVKEKETNILLPASAVPFAKDGYVAGDILLERRPENRLKTKEVITFDQYVGAGVYHINCKYLDRPSAASPVVAVQVVVETSAGTSVKSIKHLPAFTQWSRCVGVAASEAPARLLVKVSANAWLRSLQLHVTVQSLLEASSQRTMPPPPLPFVPTGDMPGLPPVPAGVPGGAPEQHADPSGWLPPAPAGPIGGTGDGSQPHHPEQDLADLPVMPVHGPSWSDGLAAAAAAAPAAGGAVGHEPASPPPPPRNLIDDPFALAAVVRSVGNMDGPGAQVPAHSCCPERYADICLGRGGEGMCV